MAIAALAAVLSLRLAAAQDLRHEDARIAGWRAKRLASLTSETGWLTPIALYWLKQGENSLAGRLPKLSRWTMPRWRPTRGRSY